MKAAALFLALIPSLAAADGLALPTLPLVKADAPAPAQIVRTAAVRDCTKAANPAAYLACQQPGLWLK